MEFFLHSDLIKLSTKNW